MGIRAELKELMKASSRAYRAMIREQVARGDAGSQEVQDAWEAAAASERAFRERHQLIGVRFSQVRG